MLCSISICVFFFKCNLLNIPLQHDWRQMPMPAAMLPPGLQEARADVCWFHHEKMVDFCWKNGDLYGDLSMKHDDGDDDDGENQLKYDSKKIVQW